MDDGNDEKDKEDDWEDDKVEEEKRLAFILEWPRAKPNKHAKKLSINKNSNDLDLKFPGKIELEKVEWEWL